MKETLPLLLSQHPQIPVDIYTNDRREYKESTFNQRSYIPALNTERKPRAWERHQNEKDQGLHLSLKPYQERCLDDNHKYAMSSVLR